MNFGKIFIVSGPAGVGKSTVCRRLLENFNGKLKKIITATTRQPRPGEVDGIDYYFFEEPTFLHHIAEDKFLEYANVYGKCYYGSPVAPVLSNLKHGVDSLLVIDVHGMANVCKNFPQLIPYIVKIFIMPEHLEVLAGRLFQRGSESADSLAQRLKSARREIRYAENYDYLVVSGTKDEDFASMKAIYELENLNSPSTYCEPLPLRRLRQFA
jgi:guanylate kinase